MSSSIAPESPSGYRPLPPRPSLEYERKQAKKLLAAWRRGDPDALKRARVHQREDANGSSREFKLADAQFVIAREYGFLSWPRLVEYFTTLARHEKSGRQPHANGREFYEGRVKSILAWHRGRRPGAANFVGSFVPRFYGSTAAEILDSELTVDDARLVVAREEMCPSWDVLLESAEPPADEWSHYQSPLTKGFEAIRQADIVALSQLIDANPELIAAKGRGGRSLIAEALIHERIARGGSCTRCSPTSPDCVDYPRAKEVTDWLIARGADATEAVNRILIGWFHMTTGDVDFAFERGADPTWMPPNGITVLEHAIFRYWNGEAVDLVARRVTPRKAFWIAAGLGDVRGIDRYLDRTGRPTEAARKHRPDFTALGPASLPMLPTADDLEILWEGFFVAGLNTRVEVLDKFLDAGFPIDYTPWGSNLLHFAVGNRLVKLVEYLVSRGANLDLKGWRPDTTPREAAEWHYQNDPSSPDTLRILELCGGRDPETVLRSFEAQRKPAAAAPQLVEILQAAVDDARRLGQTEVNAHNLFIALFRDGKGLLFVLLRAGIDVERFRRGIEHRLVPADSATPGADLPASADARAAIEAARAEAERRRRGIVTTLHLLWALMARDDGPVADILAAAGGTPAQVRERLDSML